MSVSISESHVQYTAAEFKGPPTWTSHIGTTLWSITDICRMTVFELSIEELKNIQRGRTPLKLQLFAATARANGIVFLYLVFIARSQLQNAQFDSIIIICSVP